MAEFFNDLHIRGEGKEVSPEIKEERLHEMFLEALKKGEKNVPGELVKTPEELQMISIIDQYINEHLVRRFGGIEFNMPEKNVHIIHTFLNSLSRGISDPRQLAYASSESVSLVVPRVENRMQQLGYLVHEMIHIKSYHALEQTNEGVINKYYRMGINLVSKKRGGMQSLRIFDEALTEMSSIAAVKRLVEANPELFSKEIELLSKHDFTVKDLASSGSTTAVEIEEDGKKVLSCIPIYKKEIDMLTSIRKKMSSKIAVQENLSHEEASTKVIRLFQFAKYAGKLVDLGLAIDRAFGPGTFTKLAEVSEGLGRHQHDYRDVECERMQKLIDSL